MRTLNEIYDSLLERKATYTELDVLDSTSKVSVWRNLLWVVAFAVWAHESIFEAHKKEVATLIDNDKSHTPIWYRNKVLDFQYGFALVEGDDVFDNEGFTDTQIEESKIIKNAAVEEPQSESVLIVKVATESAGNWQPIGDSELDALEYYIGRIRDAGVKFRIINFLPDKLQLNLKIKRDPNIIDSNGVSILYGNEPVKDALSLYMKNLPFNGELILNKLVDVLQNIEGVINPHLSYAKTAWIDTGLNDYGEFQNIDISIIPVSGYFNIDWENSTIDYVV